jgi:uncharacterized protein YdeI (YjbR/CyaY-like superfamily)
VTKLVPTDIQFFTSPEAFRAWLAANHETASEVWVGYHRKATGRPSLTWAQSVDQALCFGWIDGIRKALDDTTFTIRFTPRRKTSIWSAVNLKRVPELIEAGLMTPAGVRAHEGRDRRKDAIYSYENRPQALAPEYEAEFAADEGAWAWFAAQAQGYRRAATFWVMSAKQEATRRRRLAQLIEAAAAARRVGALIPPGAKRDESAGSAGS